MLSNGHQIKNIFVEIDYEENSLRHHTQKKKILLFQYQSTFFNSLEWCSVMQQTLSFCEFAFVFDLTAKCFTLDCDVCSSGRSAGTSVLSLFESFIHVFIHEKF